MAGQNLEESSTDKGEVMISEIQDCFNSSYPEKLECNLSDEHRPITSKICRDCPNYERNVFDMIRTGDSY